MGQFCYTVNNLELMFCLHDTVVKAVPCIVKYINKEKIYRQCPPRQVKSTNMNEIDNASCISSVMNIMLVLKIERQK